MEVTERSSTETSSINFVLQLCLYVAVATLLLAILWGVHPPTQNRLWDTVFDTGHILVFGIIAVLGLKLAETVAPHTRRRRHYLFGFTLSLGLGIAVEVWQLYDPLRTFELIDIANDAIGGAALLMLYRAGERRSSDGLATRALWACAALGLIALGMIPLARACWNYHRRDAAFPVIVEFTEDWCREFVATKNARLRLTQPPVGWPTEAAPRRVARVDAQKNGHYPGVSVVEPYPDWRQYNYLEIDVFSPSDAVQPFVLRVHDDTHNNKHNDRYNGACKVAPGFQTLRFSLDDVRGGLPQAQHRKLDMAHIANLRLFIPNNLAEPFTFYVGQVRLTK